jgi:hypothetical protein
MLRRYSTVFADSNQNHYKTIKTPNQPIRTNNFPKKSILFIHICLYLKSVKKSKIRMGGKPTAFIPEASTITELKKIQKTLTCKGEVPIVSKEKKVM